jgi:DEAD/DEAH box helicase domain-containing protein
LDLQNEDPVKLLLAATEDHIPVNSPDGSPTTTPLTERRADLDFFLRNPDNRPSIDAIIDEMIESEDYQNQIVDGGRRTLEERQAVFGELDQPLSQQLMDALYETKKIKQVYKHQAEAINYLDAGKSVIVSTSTSSGKSLIYQLPALKAFEKDAAATAIYIYPTKALAQDQKRGLADLLRACEHLDHIKIATFDGDTPREDRDYIRENVNVIFTNPDILHVTLMPREDQWRRMLRNLKLVVVDGKGVPQFKFEYQLIVS